METALLFFLLLDQASNYQDPHNLDQSQLRSFFDVQFLDRFGRESHQVAVLSFQVLQKIFGRGCELTYWNEFQRATKHASIPLRTAKAPL